MPLRVITFVQYITGTQEMRPEDYAGQWFIKAIKGEPLDKMRDDTLIPLPTCGWGLRQTNRHEVCDVFSAWASKYLLEMKGTVLVPVPSSSRVSTIHDIEDAPQKIALSLKNTSHGRFEVQDVLRWCTPLQAARKGGPRNEAAFYDNLYVTDSHSILETRVLLVDDVKTSGAHFRACAAKLRAMRVNVVGALAVGRTTQRQEEHPFSYQRSELDDWEPTRRAVL